MNAIKAVKTLLTEAGITTPIKLNRQPDDPSTVIVVLDTGGPQPLSEIPELAMPNFQLLIRAAEYDEGKTIVDACRAALHGKIAVEAEGVHFMFISLVAEPGNIGQDEKGREEFSANFATQIRAAA